MSFGHTGSADIIGLLPDGGFFAIECKSERGLLSEAQKLFRSKIQANNGVYVVIRAPREMIHFLMEHGFSEAAKQLLKLSNTSRRRQRSRGIA
jgi:N-acetylmuramoyl-L-alanine amidase